jgi:hypothetical protein
MYDLRLQKEFNFLHICSVPKSCSLPFESSSVPSLLLLPPLMKKEYSKLMDQHYAMKMYGGVDINLHIFITLALDGGKWSASHASHLNPWKIVPSTNFIGGWMGLRACLCLVAKEKVPAFGN